MTKKFFFDDLDGQLDDDVAPRRSTVRSRLNTIQDSGAPDAPSTNGSTYDDPLDAYMKTLDQQITNDKNVDRRPSTSTNLEDQVQSKKIKIDQVDDSINMAVRDEPSDLNEDLAATMRNMNAPTKSSKKLESLKKQHVDYQPFRKDFYIEVPELARLSKEEVDELRDLMEGIKVRGKGCPKPIRCWAHCGLSRKIMDVLKKQQFFNPTPIQAQAIPAIMSGRDVIAIAKTGCGKTLSFLLPMFRHILDQPPLESGDGPIAVVIAPTQELTEQIHNDALKFTKSLDLTVVAVYGGVNISEQIAKLKPGAHIVVCTPGRMIEILTVNNGRVTNLHRCTYLVLDEADRMFDMGFEKQIIRIVELIRPDRQTVMFSATFPKIMEAHARRILTKPIEIQVGGRSIVCKDVAQHTEIIEEDDKFLRLLQILGLHVNGTDSAIIFVDKREKADSLLQDLMQASYPCLSLHGGMDKDDRISTFASFKNGSVKVLVATSVAARGLDVKHCVCVVNYDCPNHYEDYVHRCGRTGRAGNKGFAFTFITPDQGQYACDIIRAYEMSGNTVPESITQLWDKYKSDQEAMGKKVRSASGFSGKGYKFDEAEAQLVSDKRKHQKKSLGLQDSDEEDETPETKEGDSALEQEIESMIKMGRATRTTDEPTGNKTDVSKVHAEIKNVPTVKEESNPKLSAEAQAKLELARRLASKIAMIKKLQPSSSSSLPAANSVPLAQPVAQIPPGPVVPNSIAMTIAEQRAEMINVRMNYAGHSRNDDDDVTRYEQDNEDSNQTQPTANTNRKHEEEFVINHFPQQVRWKITSKEALANISEASEAGITVRGKYCPPGEEPSEKKLYLAVEGTSKESVNKAFREIAIIIKDELNKISNQAPAANRGRFKI